MFNLYLTKLPGNKFVNSIIFGLAEALAVVCSGVLMNLLSDMKVFNIIMASGIFSYTIFIFFPDINAIMIYISNCLFVGSLGGMQNLGFLIAELRVPPQSLGSVNMISQTIGVGFGILVPFISQLPGTYPLVVGGIYSIIACFAMFALPSPGDFLEKVADESSKNKASTAGDNSVVDDYKDARSAIGSAPLSSYALHNLSFNETFMDRSLSVRRPRLQSEKFSNPTSIKAFLGGFKGTPI